MNKKQRTSVNDLDANGYELSEEHLRLAAGGDLAVGGGGGGTVALKKTIGFDRTGCSNNVCWDTIYKAD